MARAEILSRTLDEASMIAFARQLAKHLRKGDCLAFYGDLGAGKTTFIRALIQHLCGTETVPSPTFTLVQTYDSPVGDIWHFDLYRLKQPDEVYELGIEEALAGGIMLIEWPERAKALLPASQLQLHLKPAQNTTMRTLTLIGDPAWAARLTPLNQH